MILHPLSPNGDSYVTHEAGEVYTDLGANWNDQVDGSGELAGVGDVNVTVPGIYTLTFNHTDAAGNAATQVTRTVQVVDRIAPVISLNGDAVVTHEAQVQRTRMRMPPEQTPWMALE